MSDLSRLLEDVYGDGGAVYGDGSSPPAVPDWSSDEALDDTFASWVPGPPADAPAAERAFAVDDSPVRERPTFDEVFAAFGPEDASELVAEVEVEGDIDAAVETDPVAVAEIPELGDLTDVADLAGFTETFTPATELAAAAPEPIAAPRIITRWMPSDDDILPTKGNDKKRRAAAAKAPKPLAAASAPKARFQRSRKPAAPVQLAAAEAVDVDTEVEAAEVSVAVAVEAAKRRSFRRPAPKHAKPKARLHLARRGSGGAPADAEAPVAEAATRRGFRQR
jgi:hypothetical protein